VTAHGGPQPESTIEYTIRTDKIASVSSGGLINAMDIGITTVIGKAVGHASDNTMVVYSQVSDRSHYASSDVVIDYIICADNLYK